MPCSSPHLARLAFRRPAYSSTSAALVASIRVQPTYPTTTIPIYRSPATLWRAKLHTAATARILSSPPHSTTRHDHDARWKLCQVIQTLVRKNEVGDALRYLTKLPLSAISPRRYSHVILHGLLRKGLIPEASFYAQHCLNRGINVRKLSLEAVVLGMVQSVQAYPSSKAFAPTVPLDAASILKIAPATNQNPEIIRSALALYEAERVSGKRPSDRFFRYLVVLCIVNGEIILASLLFGTIMREWQTRDMAERALRTAPSSQSDTLPQNAIYRLHQICHFLNESLAADSTGPASRFLQSASLQALAQLAHSLDHGHLPYGLVNFLIKTMLLCPRGSAMVWIPGNSPDDPPRHVNAYMYIHRVLQRLIRNLSAQYRHVNEHRHPNFTWLASRDYIKLLEYTLKHRRSLNATRGIMQHMAEENSDMLQAPELRNVVLHATATFPRGVIRELMREFNLEAPSLKWDPDTTDYTYSTVITAMIKAGQSQAVMDAIPALLPGLFSPRHDESISWTENKIRWRDLEEEGLQRGAKLGPVVFVCLMNAARSLGNTKFCERIFEFALTAQERSWPRGPGNVPWCLPAHAYTLMVRVYAREMGFSMNSVATKWGQWNKDELVPRPVMGRRMILATVRRMVKEARELEERVHRVRRGRKPQWRYVPYPDGFFFKALIDAFARTPDDPIYAALKSEMEAEGFRPPGRYLKSLKPREAGTQLGLDERSWRRSKDVRPYSLPPKDGFRKRHAPAVYTKKVPNRWTTGGKKGRRRSVHINTL